MYLHWLLCMALDLDCFFSCFTHFCFVFLFSVFGFVVRRLLKGPLVTDDLLYTYINLLVLLRPVALIWAGGWGLTVLNVTCRGRVVYRYVIFGVR